MKTETVADQPTFLNVAARLEEHGARRLPDGSLRAACPAHGSKNKTSLSVRQGEDGRPLLYCFAHGCDWGDILAALGFEVSASYASAEAASIVAERRRTLERLDNDIFQLQAFLAKTPHDNRLEIPEAPNDREAERIARECSAIAQEIDRISSMTRDERRLGYAHRVLGARV